MRQALGPGPRPQSSNRWVRQGALHAAGMLPAVVPLGLAFGSAVAEHETSIPVAWLGAALLLAGSAQLSVATQTAEGSGALAAGAVAIAINSRFVIYGAALAHRFRGQPRWFRWVGPWFVVDQMYALVEGREPANTERNRFREYYVTAGSLLWIGWQLSVVAGATLGPSLPTGSVLELIVPVMFTALVAPSLIRPNQAVAAAAGGAVAFGSATAGSVGVLLAAGAGAVIGAVASSRAVR
jgi:predicted branched-subunit amino acid permease